jgi:ABC-type bacteriocin/lantibiotic exporter with double-glycine peptidase domain
MLSVPLVAQSKTMSCWHASAEMIWLYWQRKTGRQGPMFTLVTEWSANSGINVSATDFVRLARAVGLKPVPRQHMYTSADLIGMLRKYGPLWCAGEWYGAGHVVVLTGVDGKMVHINDPDKGMQKIQEVSWFNQKLFNSVDGALMFKDPNAY